MGLRHIAPVTYYAHWIFAVGKAINDALRQYWSAGTNRIPCLRH